MRKFAASQIQSHRLQVDKQGVRFTVYFVLFSVLTTVSYGASPDNRAGVFWLLHEDEHIRTGAEDIRSQIQTTDDYLHFSIRPENMTPLRPQDSYEKFEAGVDAQLRSLAGKKKPELFLFLVSHGRPGALCLRTNTPINYSTLVRSTLSKVAAFQKNNGPLTVNMLNSSCYSGTIIDEFKRQLADKSVAGQFKINVATSAPSHDVSHAVDTSEALVRTNRQLKELGPKAQTLCEGCSDFYRFGRIFALNGVDTDQPQFWSTEGRLKPASKSESIALLETVGSPSEFEKIYAESKNEISNAELTAIMKQHATRNSALFEENAAWVHGEIARLEPSVENLKNWVRLTAGSPDVQRPLTQLAEMRAIDSEAEQMLLGWLEHTSQKTEDPLYAKLLQRYETWNFNRLQQALGSEPWKANSLAHRILKYRLESALGRSDFGRVRTILFQESEALLTPDARAAMVNPVTKFVQKGSPLPPDGEKILSELFVLNYSKHPEAWNESATLAALNAFKNSTGRNYFDRIPPNGMSLAILGSLKNDPEGTRKMLLEAVEQLNQRQSSEAFGRQFSNLMRTLESPDANGYRELVWKRINDLQHGPLVDGISMQLRSAADAFRVTRNDEQLTRLLKWIKPLRTTDRALDTQLKKIIASNVTRQASDLASAARIEIFKSNKVQESKRCLNSFSLLGLALQPMPN